MSDKIKGKYVETRDGYYGRVVGTNPHAVPAPTVTIRRQDGQTVTTAKDNINKK